MKKQFSSGTGVYMKGARGPFQTSITIHVQNLVVTSPDETKVLR